MDVNIKQAVKLFFSNPSLEMVYFEAIANSLDAESTEIDIELSIEEFSKPETLTISIKDNGVGFTDVRFSKFKELLKVEEESHKGVGRLVFLSYFKNVNITSIYESKKRIFEFSENFDGESDVTDPYNEPNETVISFKNYYRKKIASHEYLRPESLIRRIKEEFYPRLYLLKKQNKDVQISISLNVSKPDEKYSFQTDKRHIRASELPELKIEKVDVSIIEMFKEAELHYSIIKKDFDKTIITALCVDGRSYKQEIISDDNVPFGYEIIFLLNSDLFTGQVDPSRQNLTLKDNILKPITVLFRNKVSEILKREIPEMVKRNKETREDLINKYPHLLDYIEVDTVGFIKRDETIKKAQDKFFKDQKEILESPDFLSEDDYDKALEISSKLLTEYILYRQITINRLKQINVANSEFDIHSLIIPPRKKKYVTSDFMTDIFSNNVWLLDDKYMTYNTIFSDKVMSEIVKEITQDDVVEKDNSEPDIAIIFSNNPDTNAKVDVVIVELKKMGVSLNENVTVYTQLQTRATRLMHLYPNKIQRIWFYGIADIDNAFQLNLVNNRFIPLYSTGMAYYREDIIKTSLTATESHIVGIHIISFDAFIEDANTRNSTFLNILKSNFREKIAKKEEVEAKEIKQSENTENK